MTKNSKMTLVQEWRILRQDLDTFSSWSMMKSWLVRVHGKSMAGGRGAVV